MGQEFCHFLKRGAVVVVADNTERKQRPATFKPGQSGNPAGRPKGSRNKLGEEFLDALYSDFQENGAAVIARVRVDKPDAYLKVVASLMPRELKVDQPPRPITSFSDAELEALLHDALVREGIREEED